MGAGRFAAGLLIVLSAGCVLPPVDPYERACWDVRHGDLLEAWKSAELARYQGVDPFDLPNYGMTDAALYLGIAPSTLRSWTLGRRYRVKGKERVSKPLIKLPDGTSGGLSHHNPVEAFVLDSIRKTYRIRISEVRDALDYATRNLGIPHPLASEFFSTDRVYLFIQQAEGPINVSMRGKVGQMALPGLIEPYLKRIAFDEQGRPKRLFLFTRRIAPRMIRRRRRSAH